MIADKKVCWGGIQQQDSFELNISTQSTWFYLYIIVLADNHNLSDRTKRLFFKE